MYLAVYTVALASASRAVSGSHDPTSLNECDINNWGVAGGENEDEPPMDKTAEEQVQCEFTYSDLEDHPSSYLNWYDTPQDYKDFRAIDMTPSRHWEYLPELQDPYYEGRELIRSRSRLWSPGRNGPPDAKKKIQLGECQVPQADGGAWHVQRVGPFVSNGGYDWWQVGWRDIFRLSEVLKKHPEGIYYTTTFSAGVDPTGKPLSLPPIHLHHIHVNPQPSARKKLTAGVSYVSNMVIEMHGDYVCQPQHGGVNCYFEVPAKNEMQEIRQVLDVEGDLNDVRAPGSPPMEWWYQVVVRWHPKSSKPNAHPLSQIFYLGKGYKNKTDQSQELSTFDIATSKSTVFWYTGTMWSDGELVRNKIHAHNLMFREAFWFRASPEDLGLDKLPENTEKEYGQPLEQLGFNSFIEFKSYLTANLDASRKKYESTCESKSFLGKTSFIARHGFDEQSTSSGECQFGKPFTVCRSSGKTSRDIYDEQTQRTYVYDRRATSCCDPWTWKAGEIFTTIGLYFPADRLAGPWETSMPETFPQHLNWIMTYKGPEAEWGRSFYTWAQNMPYITNVKHTLGQQTPTQLLHGDALYYANKSQWKIYITRDWPDHLYSVEMDEVDDSSMMQTSIDRQSGHPQWVVWQLLHKPHQHLGLLMPFAAITGIGLASFLGMKRALHRLGICRGRGPVVASVVCDIPCCPCMKPTFAQ
jgi:hypothetical protein